MMLWWGVPLFKPPRGSKAKAGSVNRASKWRGDNDFYPTPSGATQALCDLKILPLNIWEPACGNGALAKVLEQNGHRVLSSDLSDYGFGERGIDFLLSRRGDWEGAIVTNPPFHLANEFVVHALSLKPVMAAFFLRLKFLEGRRRYDLLMRENPPSDIYVFIERVKFFSGDYAKGDQPGWNTEAFAWFIWKRNVREAPRIHWISRGAA